MAKGRSDPREHAEAEVFEVRVAQVRAPSGTRRPRVGGRWALGLVIVALVIFAAPRPTGPRAPAARRTSPAARAPGAAGVVGAYGFPRRCLSITIAPQHPAYARADFDRRQACGRYTGDPTAVFHRSGGAWHLVLDAADYTCPVAWIPAPVQATLAVCDTGAHTKHRE